MLYFVFSSLALFRIARTSELARRSLRYNLPIFPPTDNFNDYHTDGRNIRVKLHENFFASPRKVQLPPSIIIAHSFWEPDYNGLYFDSLPQRFIGPSTIDPSADNNTDDGYDSDDVSGNDSDDCHNPRWTKLQFPVCNVVHETNFDSATNEYLGYVAVILSILQCSVIPIFSFRL